MSNVNTPHSNLTSFKYFSSISEVLHFAGALAVASAMGLFLLDGVDVANDLQRFITMLGFGGALTGAGLLMNYLLREQRGSRVFIGLSLISIPVNFTVFGAMLYSIIPWDNAIGDYPGFAYWSIGSIAEFGLVLPIAAVVVALISWFGFSVMARRDRRWLTITMIASNVLLLIPVRQDYFIAVLALGLIIALHAILRRYGKESVALRTLEGRVAVGSLFLTPVILIARSFFLYEVGGYLLLAVSASAFYIIRQFLYRQSEHSTAEVALTLIGGFAALATAAATFDIAEQWLPISISLPVAYACLLGCAWQLAAKNPQAVTGRSVNVVSITLVAITASLQALHMASFVTAILTALVLITVMVMHLSQGLRVEATAAGLGLLGLMVFHASIFWEAIISTGWWGIALAGSLAIVCGSLLEKIPSPIKTNSEADAENIEFAEGAQKAA